MAIERTCQSCRFFAGGYRGDCKRRAPTANLRNGVAHPVFPEVKRESWCGDYEVNAEVWRELQKQAFDERVARAEYRPILHKGVPF